MTNTNQSKEVEIREYKLWRDTDYKKVITALAMYSMEKIGTEMRSIASEAVQKYQDEQRRMLYEEKIKEAEERGRREERERIKEIIDQYNLGGQMDGIIKEIEKLTNKIKVE